MGDLKVILFECRPKIINFGLIGQEHLFSNGCCVTYMTCRKLQETLVALLEMYFFNAATFV